MDVENAILLLGYKPDSNGNIQEGTKRRADLAAQLYHQGVAPVVISSGWYCPKNKELRQFCEAEIMMRHLHATYGEHINVLCEPYSTSVPENLLFTRVMFPNLREVTVVAGERFEERARFLAKMTFGDTAKVTVVAAEDGLSDKNNEERLLTNLRCILKDKEPGDITQLLREPEEDGILRSWWPKLNEDHKRDCLRHT